MSTTLQPIKVYGKGGPNPPKIPMILLELNLPYEIEDIPIADVKKPYFTAINPNGRIPAIHDPNTNLTLWESGAIIEYLVETYDKNNSISYPASSNEAYHSKQWLHFQVSGQGPYYGQGVFFTRWHPEKIPSAIQRYINEAKRVSGVLEAHLEKQKARGGDGPWLVGDRFTYADLSFVPWQVFAGIALAEWGFEEDEFPVVKDWLRRLDERPAIGKVMGEAVAKVKAMYAEAAKK